MPIEFLKLRNFQKHEKIRLQFSPGINSIRGATDSGKSAILRALRWTALNDFPGDSFIRQGAEESLAILSFDGRKVKRRKGKANLYSLDGEDFRAFGNGVPEEIVQVLSLSPINFQSQHDAPFWFSESAAEVSRQLNSVVDLSVIDTSLSHIANEVRRAQERVQLTEERLLSYREELEELAGQRARVSYFNKLKKLHDDAEQIETDRGKLEHVTQRIRANLKAELEAKDRTEDGARLAAKCIRGIELTNQAVTLSGLVSKIRKTRLRAIPPPDLEPLASKFILLKKFSDQSNELEKVMKTASRASTAADTAAAAAERFERRLNKLTIGNKCPLCGRDYDRIHTHK